MLSSNNTPAVLRQPLCHSARRDSKTQWVHTSQLRPVKPWLQVHVYSQASSGLPAEGRTKQSPPLRHGRPSQGFGRGVAWVGVGSAGAGVSGASWKAEGADSLLHPRSRRSRGNASLSATCVWRQDGTAGTVDTLIHILILSVWLLLSSFPSFVVVCILFFFLPFAQSCCWCRLGSAETQR